MVVTGCATVADGKAGLMVPEAADMAGPGLRAVCKALGIPPVLHLGSCVDNTPHPGAGGCPGKHLGVDISALPLAGAAPEWYSEKAVAIGAYVVASGIFTVLGDCPAGLWQPERRQAADRRAGRRLRRDLCRRAGPEPGGCADPPPHREEAPGIRSARARSGKHRHAGS